MPDAGSLKDKTLSGLFWNFFDLIATHGVQFLIQITLARILLPEHFGLIGMILIFIAISNSIVDSGFSQSLIRDQYTTQEDYSTIFFFNLFISLIVYGVIYICAPWISNFFGESQLIQLVRVLSLVLVINALGIIQRVMLVKKVDFKTQTKVSIIAVLISGTIAITLACLGFGVWSLVVNLLSTQFIQTLLLWIFNKWVPSLIFSIQSFKKHFGFGYKLLLSGLIDTFYNNLYFLIIGRFYSTNQLGLYTNAVKMRDLASQSLASTIQRVSYPILSSIQEDEKRLKSAFKKVIKVSAFINFPLMIGLVVVAKPLFTIFLGEKWIPAVVYFQLLCLAGMLYPLHALNLNILQVKGRSDLFLLLEIIKKSVMTILIVLSLLFGLGIIGLISASVISSYISLGINTFFSSREISYSGKEQLKDLFPTYLTSIFMGVVVYLVGNVLPDNEFIKLFCQICVGVVFYIVACKLAKIQELGIIYRMIQDLLKKYRFIRFKKDRLAERKYIETK